MWSGGGEAQLTDEVIGAVVQAGPAGPDQRAGRVVGGVGDRVGHQTLAEAARRVPGGHPCHGAAKRNKPAPQGKRGGSTESTTTALLLAWCRVFGGAVDSRSV